MNRNTRARIAGLCLLLSATAVAAFAAPPAPQPCTCEYCSHAPSNRSCVFDGTTTTCGSFLAVTLCLP